MNSFSSWTEADIARHNARVSKENKIPVVETPAAGSEAELHEAILADCRRRGWLVFYGRMDTRTSRTVGEPDFTCLCDYGRTLLIECKTAKGKLSPAQQACIAHAKKNGHTVHVVRSFREFLDVADGGLL